MTEEMVTAGRLVLSGYEPGWCDSSECVVDIYEAMKEGHRNRGPLGTPAVPELTEEMIEAGALVVYGHEPEFDSNYETAITVFHEMVQAASDQ